jgi:hypothetical protein
VGHRVAAEAEAAGEDPLDRRDGRSGGDPEQALLELGLDRVQGLRELRREVGHLRQRRNAVLAAAHAGHLAHTVGDAVGDIPGGVTGIERRAAADAAFRPAAQAVHAGDDGELARPVLIVAELGLKRTQAALELQVRLPQAVVLPLQAGDFCRARARMEVGPDEEGGDAGQEEEGAGGQADLQVRHAPLAQLRVGMGDEDDSVVRSRHRMGFF